MMVLNGLTIYEGRNTKRFREMPCIKQEAQTAGPGEGWTQRKISLPEQKEVVEPALLEQVARVSKVPVDAIKNFEDEAAINIIGNTVTNHDNSAVVNYYPNFNPLDKWVEEIADNRRLYERLLQAEKEKMELLKQLLDKVKRLII